MSRKLTSYGLKAAQMVEKSCFLAGGSGRGPGARGLGRPGGRPVRAGGSGGRGGAGGRAGVRSTGNADLRFGGASFKGVVMVTAPASWGVGGAVSHGRPPAGGGWWRKAPTAQCPRLGSQPPPARGDRGQGTERTWLLEVQPRGQDASPRGQRSVSTRPRGALLPGAAGGPSSFGSVVLSAAPHQTAPGAPAPPASIPSTASSREPTPALWGPADPSPPGQAQPLSLPPGGPAQPEAPDPLGPCSCPVLQPAPCWLSSSRVGVRAPSLSRALGHSFFRFVLFPGLASRGASGPGAARPAAQDGQAGATSAGHVRAAC